MATPTTHNAPRTIVDLSPAVNLICDAGEYLEAKGGTARSGREVTLMMQIVALIVAAGVLYMFVG